MLLACQSCHRQYDAGDLGPGERMRCFCGALTTVPRESARQVPMQHCSHCGAALAGGEGTCTYCEATVTIAERGWGDSCPECLARMVNGAKYCGACGVAIEVEAALRPLAGKSCPRCKLDLALCERGGEALVECTRCGGIWLPRERFEALLEERQRQSVADALPAGVPSSRADLPELERHPVTYMPCPECGELMNRQNFASTSGIMIDFCRAHGMWFDLHELEHIQAFVAQGGLDEARRKREQRSEFDREAAQRAVKRMKLSGHLPGRRHQPQSGVELVGDMLITFLSLVFSGSSW